MRRIARVVCPLAAVTIVASTMAGIANFDPEPEATTRLGIIVVTLLLTASQIPLAVAPFVRNAVSRVRVLLALGMLPTALLILVIAIDLAPRVVSSRATNRTLVIVLATAAVAYTLGFLTLRRSRPLRAQ